ncbi:hypothetical protein DFP73DRAFT_280245 [Morchella snyderi]|nr:hypothetical protein DFP73DRAFT_280245 [Morchella snyderi]
MSTSLDPTIPLQKTAEITKHLRSHDVPLTALLPFALRILDNTGGKENEKNIYFPQKEDWLLEWLVQRLRQDDSCAPEARCDPEFWVFLLRLLPMSPSAGGILKKHNILQLISKALSEAALLQKRDLTALRVQGRDEDIDMDHEEIYSTPKERLSSDSSASSPEQILLLLRAPPRLQDLLASVSGVLSYIQGNLGAGKSDGNIVVVLRGTPEAGAQILGSFLEACHVLIQEGIEIEEEWINTVVNVWRSCVWGNPQLKKLSMIFSTSCLVPATHLLMTPSIPSNFRRKLEQLLAEFIFPHEILFPAGLGTTGLSSKELKPLLGPLKAQKDGLSNIFRIAITSQTKRRKPDSTFVEVIFESITSAILGILFPIKSINTRDTEIVMSLLEVLIETGTSISSNTIAELVDGISNLSHGNTSSVIRWDIIAVALKLDFDVFLGKGNEERALKLFNSLTNNFSDQETVYEVVKLLIDGFVKARDLGGFANIWISELRKEGARDGIWESDRVTKLFSERMEASLLPGQIENVLKTAIQENSWVVIEGLLRGMKREDTHNKVKPLLNKITDKILEGEVGWRGWRALVRVLQIKSGLADGMQGKILNILKKYVERGTNNDARSALFIGEVLMDSADDEGQDEVICMFIKAMKSTTRSWDRSIGDINPENLGVAIVLGVIGRWMTALERAQSDIRTKFVDEFLSMAIENDTAQRASDLTGRMLWQSMLVRGVSYEHPSLKDAILAALVTKLGSRFEISQDMNASLRDIEKGGDVPMTEKDVECYKFLIQSISKFPLEAIKRTIRERILDVLVLLDSSLKKEGSSVLLRDVVKRLVARLWALGNASSFLMHICDEGARKKS